MFGVKRLTLSNRPTDAIMLQSGDTQQLLIQSLWPDNTWTFFPETEELASEARTSELKGDRSVMSTFVSQVPNPQSLIPWRWDEGERPVLRENQVPHHALVPPEIKHSMAFRTETQPRKCSPFISGMPRPEGRLTSPVRTFQILITPFSKPVASSRGFFPFVVRFDEWGLGPKASPHTGWPQLKLLSPRSVVSLWPSLWARATISKYQVWVDSAAAPRSCQVSSNPANYIINYESSSRTFAAASSEYWRGMKNNFCWYFFAAKSFIRSYIFNL